MKKYMNNSITVAYYNFNCLGFSIVRITWLLKNIFDYPPTYIELPENDIKYS